VRHSSPYLCRFTVATASGQKLALEYAKVYLNGCASKEMRNASGDPEK